MTLPRKRERPRSGILRAPRRVWNRHRKFVRGHRCSVPYCQDGPIEFAHVRSAADAGTGLKPHDWFGVSLCKGHHKEQHDHGAETFVKKYSVDLWRIAAEFAARSPDRAMKDEMPLDRRMAA